MLTVLSLFFLADSFYVFFYVLHAPMDFANYWDGFMQCAFDESHLPAFAWENATNCHHLWPLFHEFPKGREEAGRGVKTIVVPTVMAFGEENTNASGFGPTICCLQK